MTILTTRHEFRVDLDNSPLEARLPRPLSHQDALADCFTAVIRRGMEPVDLTGMTVLGYLCFTGTRQTLPLSGTVSGSTAEVTLTSDCYAIPGPFSFVLQLLQGDVRHTVLRVNGEIARCTTDELLSSELLPPLPELLADIAHMQSATQDCADVTSDCRQAIAEAAVLTALAAPRIVTEAAGAAPAMPDAAAHLALIGASLFGQTQQTAVPSPVLPVNPQSTSEPALLVTTGGVTSAFPVPGAVLRSVPTTDKASASYVDADGNAWIADEVDFARGVILRRIGIAELDGTESWTPYGLTDRAFCSYAAALPDAANRLGNGVVCSHYPGLCSYADLYYGRSQAAFVGNSNSAKAQLIIGDTYASADAFKGWLAEQAAAGTPVTLCYPLAEPLEEPLDEALVTAFSTLRTAPDMTATGGAWVRIRYVADTKSYVDDAANHAGAYARQAGHAQEATHAADADTVGGVDVLARLAQLSPAIVCESAGRSIVTDDAAALPLQDLSVSFDPLQSGSGTPSPDNVRPILPHGSVAVTRCGKNLFAVDGSGSYIGEDGSLMAVETASTTVRIPCEAGENFTLSSANPFAATPGNTGVIAYYDQTGACVGRTEQSDGYAVTATAPEHTAYMMASCYAPVEADDIQLEAGTERTAYAPSNASTCAIAIPDTVYGGILNVTSGELQESNVFFEVTGNETIRTWGVNYIREGLTGFYVRLNELVRGDDQASGLIAEPTPVCASWLKPDISSYGGSRSNACTFGGLSTTNPSIILSVENSLVGILDDDTNETAEERMATYLQAHPLQVVGKRSVARVIPLNAGQLELLRKHNRLWSTNGLTTASYIADPKLYIDRRIAELTA
ncbi:MAG: hypothetical protein ACI4MG_09865 [Aristaeellaceae bacterium]